MNFSTKCATRVLALLATSASIFLAVGCGSGSSGIATRNNEGFSQSSLNGTYVFSAQGEDVNGDPIAIAGTIVTAGSGTISTGTIDIVDPGLSSIPSPTAQTISAGSYTVGADGRGQATVNASTYGSYTFDFVLTSTSHGLVTLFDGHGTGSGTIDLQSGITSTTGNYVFSLSGLNSSGYPLATVGAFTVSSGGAVTGVEDANDNLVVLSQSLSGNATLGTGTGPGQITLTTTSLPLTFDFYPIDSTHWKIIETDGANFLAGDIFNQTSTTIPSGTMAFTMSGGVTAPVADAGFLTYNGTSFTGTEDINNNGTVVTQVGFTGTAGAVGTVGGRVVLTLTSFNPATTVVVYPFSESSGQTGLLMLEIDGTTVTSGTAYTQQTGATLGTSQPFGFNLSAFNTSNEIEEDDIAQFTTSSSGFSGVVDINDDTTLNGNQSFNGTFPVTINSAGEGQATTTEGGSQFVSFLFYAVSNDTFLVLETDSNQIGTGIFELQSSSSSAAARQSHMSMLHAVARSHGARSRKSK